MFLKTNYWREQKAIEILKSQLLLVEVVHCVEILSPPFPIQGPPGDRLQPPLKGLHPIYFFFDSLFLPLGRFVVMSSISFIIQACLARAQHTRRIHKSKNFFYTIFIFNNNPVFSLFIYYYIKYCYIYFFFFS